MAFSKRHYRLVAEVGSRQADDGQGPRRIAERQAGEQAHADALAKFGAVTAENARDFIAYQEERRQLHLKEEARG